MRIIFEKVLVNENPLCKTSTVPKAILQSQNLTHSAVDESTGIISGCKLMQVGRTANFKSADGKPRSFEVTPELIKGLLSHAGNRSIPCHLTHETEGLHARLGLHKNLRIDDDGDLASDLHTMPNDQGKLALWTAKTDPSSAAFSAVFSYNPIKDGNRNLAVPTSFDAADLVAKGAACEAMLSAFNQDTDMTKDEIVALIKENAASKDDVTAALRAALADFKPAGFITKEDSEKAVKAALSEYKPTLAETDMDALLVKAEAKLVAKLGGGPLLQNIQRASAATDKYVATLAKFEETHPNKASAIQAMLSKHPELGVAHEEHLQREIAKLTNA